jgi:ABC-type uncharacterized transport system ATPase subunit
MTAPSLAESTPVEPARRPAPGLEVIKLTKHFGSFVALEDAMLKVEPGEFHALLGENGAGKSTFVKCVIGYEAPTSGDIVYDGLEVHFDGTRDAHAAGIGMVYQHFTLVPNMTVAENLVLVREVVPPVIDWKKEISELSDFMDRQPFQVPLKMPVRSLSAGQKQKLEIRRGRFAGTGRVSELTTDEMASMMIGSDKLTESAPRDPDVVRGPKLVITNLHANDDAGEPMLEGLCLTVHSGEIVGIAGVSGNGQLHLVECLAGQRPIEGGSIAVSSKAYKPTRREIREAGVRIIPEVPLANACAPDMSVSDNMALGDFDVAPIAKAKAFVSRRAIRDKARRLIAGFSVKTPSPKSPIRNLSGGNVQRAVLARELSDPCEVLVTSNPCFGLDFMATADIRARIIDSRNGGAAVLLVSSDLDELLEVSDRLCVMFDGRIVYETPTADADVTTIGKHMAGHA